MKRHGLEAWDGGMPGATPRGMICQSELLVPAGTITLFCLYGAQGSVKYVSPKAVADMRLSSLEGFMKYQPVLYRKVTTFRQEWKVCGGGRSGRCGGGRSEKFGGDRSGRCAMSWLLVVWGGMRGEAGNVRHAWVAGKQKKARRGCGSGTLARVRL